MTLVYDIFETRMRRNFILGKPFHICFLGLHHLDEPTVQDIYNKDIYWTQCKACKRFIPTKAKKKRTICVDFTNDNYWIEISA